MLYLIPTPIWNMEDITLRALRLLGELHYLICEDTRTTKKLLSLLKIDYSDKEFFSLTSFTNEWRLKHFVNIMNENDVGMLSDAGTPWLSDPGKKLIEICNDNNIGYTVLPGANAIVPAVVGAGFDTSKFIYLGFLPLKKWRQTILQEIASSFSVLGKDRLPVFFYESVHRIYKTLKKLKSLWFEWKVSISREVSKMHEQLVTANIDDVINMLERKEIVLKGEFVVWIK